jgi:dipeptidyl aminopeptidase/acylaminoacyl peptidase
MLRKNISVMNSESEIIRAELYYENATKDAPVIIIFHGFKGFKNWAFFPFLAESLAQADYVALTFNFSRNGIGPDLQNFTELERFEKNTYTHEVNDLKCLVDAIFSGEIGKGLIDPDKIGLMGHSRGGGIALLHTQNDPRIKSLVTWSSIATVERYSKEQLELWKTQKYLEFENKRTGQLMRVGLDLYHDIQKNKKDLNIQSAAENIETPTLIIHGQNDESVPVEEAQVIYDHLASPSKEIIIIEGGTHTYGAHHPMESMPEELQTVFDLTENWFDRYLR